MFFALKGGSFNGNEFAVKALSLGCAFVVVDEDVKEDSKVIRVKDVLETLQELANYHRSQMSCPVLALTGSNGKTTTKELIAAVLSEHFKVHATAGNFNNHIGVPLTILSAPLNTEVLVVEMGANHQKEIAKLCEIAAPDYGLISNIGLAHLEGFGGVEGVKKGKTELYDYLLKNKGVILFNNDEKSIQEFKGRLKNHVEYGTGTKVIVTDTTSRRGLLSVTLCIDGVQHELFTQLFGAYNVNNILTAAAIGSYFKVDQKSIVKALSSYAPANSRSEVKQTEKGNYIVLDAYNANPTSMQHAVKEFGELADENAVFILGDMLELGEESEKEHLFLLDVLRSYKGEKYLVGSQFFKYQDRFTFYFDKDVSSLKIRLKKNNYKDKKILIKGSRGIALEGVLEDL